MRLVYMDEAGISNPTQEPFVVVSGAMVDADVALNGIENELERILLRNIPERHRNEFVFHATQLFNGGGKVFKRVPEDFIGPPEWPLDRRLKIADEIMAIPRKFKLPIAIGWIERAKFRQQFNLPPEIPDSEATIAAHVAAFMNCAMWVERWMRRETINENCLLVVENNNQAKQMIGDVQRYHQDKKIVDLLTEESRPHFPFRKIREDPLFQPKRQSSALIVADFCAYVLKKSLMKDSRYDRFLDPIRDKLIVYEDL